MLSYLEFVSESNHHDGSPGRSMGLFPRFCSLGLMFGVMLGTTACDRSYVEPINNLSLEVKTGARPGVYELSGSTNLPEGTELMVQALRQLNPTGQAVPEDSPNEHYAILDRDRVEVEGGKWRIALQLWQADDAGEPAESWQLSLPQSDTSFTADSQVLFSVSMPPTGDERTLERQWEESQANPSIGIVNFTPDGEWYLEAQSKLSLAPPSPSIPEQPDTFDAAADLSPIKAGLPTDKDVPIAGQTEKALAKRESTTDAPLQPSELMR